jgi:hydroxymethylpyrimidine pyrophosphatase-like HAD family hydrolase
MRKLIICDIDGCLFKHTGPLVKMAKKKKKAELIEGAAEKTLEWERKGYTIILTTGRRSCHKKFTKWQLRKAGIYYDKLIMNVGTGQRILINDLKPDNNNLMAIAFNIKRNSKELSEIDI